ncbi:hypothetical protein [Paludisphaera mucosa]|uniref:Glycosyl hydrolase-like 10 domain-containing protein n=1 Tax=Paludisphaera mucosa TaxID=3030827 RepID=A0ABT6FHR0_9BACT|nr:hypothetical protein [Paludisphaera mucosa]MDG3007128.1 hypothetical protein [Paludisphaera mucosa]
MTRPRTLPAAMGLPTVLILALAASRAGAEEPPPRLAPRPNLLVRGVYGGVPTAIFERGETLDDHGINAVWIGSGGATAEVVAGLKAKAPGVRVFAEFNTMHDAEYLADHPDAAPVGPDGLRCPAPDGWQGVCPTHPDHRRERMAAFRKTLADAPLDGVWLDYHHAHASWEQAEPNLPDTCFCRRCLASFGRDTGVALGDGPTPEIARRLLGEHREAWVAWRCGVFTDWVREFRGIVEATRPGALLGTFHCPWTDAEREGALREKLAIDLKAQAAYVDVFSIMPYHARFGHAADPGWISRQTAWLGRFLGVRGEPGERVKIWPIVQLADWGEAVRPEDVRTILDHGTRPPASGVLIFHWQGVGSDQAKLRAMGRAYRELRP